MSNSPSTLPPPQQTPPQSQQKPAFKDTDGGKAIVARQTIYGHQTLPEGAKLLYCFLLHTSFNKQTIPHKNGVVEISIKEISEGIHCCTRSINKWKKMLSAEGLIWVEKRKLPNAWDLNVYHITALSPKTGAKENWGKGWGNGHPDPSMGKKEESTTPDSLPTPLPVERLQPQNGQPKTSTLPIPTSSARHAETEFIEAVESVCEKYPHLCKNELTNFGQVWRKWFRTDPTAARKVLTDVDCAAHEGTIKTNLGAYAVKLWQKVYHPPRRI